MACLESAIQIAAKAHTGQVDKNGQPYLLHPIRVMLDVQTPEERIVAVLHDVVEDTSVTLDNIRSAGFSDDIVEALRCVTREEGQSYSDYVRRCRNNKIARQVKLADLKDNLSLTRVLFSPETIDADSTRLKRYLLSYKFLMNTISEDEYCQQMVLLN